MSRDRRGTLNQKAGVRATHHRHLADSRDYAECLTIGPFSPIGLSAHFVGFRHVFSGPFPGRGHLWDWEQQTSRFAETQNSSGPLRGISLKNAYTPTLHPGARATRSLSLQEPKCKTAPQVSAVAPARTTQQDLCAGNRPMVAKEIFAALNRGANVADGRGRPAAAFLTGSRNAFANGGATRAGNTPTQSSPTNPGVISTKESVCLLSSRRLSPHPTPDY